MTVSPTASPRASKSRTELQDEMGDRGSVTSGQLHGVSSPSGSSMKPCFPAMHSRWKAPGQVSHTTRSPPLSQTMQVLTDGCLPGRWCRGQTVPAPP